MSTDANTPEASRLQQEHGPDGSECNTLTAMPGQRITTFRLDEDLWAGLQAIKERDGVPVGEQIRRGIQLWLDAKGLKLAKGRKASRPRPRTRV